MCWFAWTSYFNPYKNPGIQGLVLSPCLNKGSRTWRVTCPRSYGKGTIQPGFLVQKGLLQSPSTVPPRSSESEWAVPAHFHIDLKPKVLLNRLGTHGGMAELCYEIYIAGPWQHVPPPLPEATQDILSVFPHCMHLFVFSEIARASDDKCMPQYGRRITVGTAVLPSFHGCSASPSRLWVVSGDCLVALTLH